MAGGGLPSSSGDACPRPGGGGRLTAFRAARLPPVPGGVGGGGSTLNPGVFSPGAAVSPGLARSLTDSPSPPAGRRAKGSAESHAQPAAPPFCPARGRGGAGRRSRGAADRAPVTAARRLRSLRRWSRLPAAPFPLPRERLLPAEEVAPCLVGRCRKFPDSGGRERGTGRLNK